MVIWSVSCVDGLFVRGKPGACSQDSGAVIVAEEVVAGGVDLDPESNASFWSCDGLMHGSTAESACTGSRAALAREGGNSCKGRGELEPSIFGGGA